MSIADAIICSGLTKVYGSKTALKNLDLKVQAGEIFGYLGSNGAGKTTTIRCLLDLIRPTDGHATILGLDCRRDSVETRRRCGYLPGDLRLYPRLTARQLVVALGRLRGVECMARAQELAARLDCAMDQPCGSMSHGQRQKVGVIQAIMHQPRVLILDEPTATLDPLAQHAVHDLIREAREHGTTVFVSSHDLREVSELCDRAGILRLGELVTIQNVRHLAKRGRHTVTIEFGEIVDAKEFATMAGVSRAKAEGKAVTLEVEGDLDSVIKAAARFHVREIRTAEIDLDEVFRDYYQGGPETGLAR